MKYPLWLTACCIGLPATQVIADSNYLPPSESYQPATAFSGWNASPNPIPFGQAPYPDSSGQRGNPSEYLPGYRYGTVSGTGNPAYGTQILSRRYNLTGWQGTAPSDHYRQQGHSSPGRWNQPPAGQWHKKAFSGDYPSPGYRYGTGQTYRTPYGRRQTYGAPYDFGTGQAYNTPYGYGETTDYGYPPPPPTDYGYPTPHSYGEQIPAPGYSSAPGYGYGYPSAGYSQPYYGSEPESGRHESYRDLPALPIYPSQQLESEYGLPWTSKGSAGEPLPVPGLEEKIPAHSAPPSSNYDDLSKKYGIPPAPGQGSLTPHPFAPAEKSATLPAIPAPKQEKPAPLAAPMPGQDDASLPHPAATVANPEMTKEEAVSASPSPEKMTASPARADHPESPQQIPPGETAPATQPATLQSAEQGSPLPAQPLPPETIAPKS